MTDGSHRTMPNVMAVTQSHTRWSVAFGRHRLEVSRTRESRTIGHQVEGTPSKRHSTRPIWPLVIGTFTSVSAFGLVVAGALASESSLSYRQPRYSLNVPLPERARKRNTNDLGARSRRNRAASAIASTPVSSLRSSSLDGPVQRDEAYVAQAMRTGELQEWLDADGQRRFLTVGPVIMADGLPCRDMAMLIRRSDGSDQAQNTRRCMNKGLAKATVPQTPDDRLGTVEVRDNLENSSAVEPSWSMLENSEVAARIATQ